ncbi:MAG TPA: ubiquinol-cytochrome c reductase iron-sulfur subunit [Nitrospiria bacterium]
MMNLKIKSRVRCTDREVGEVSHVVVNAVTKEISHLVLATGGSAGGQRLVPIEDVSEADSNGVVTLRRASSELSSYPAFSREEFLELKEVELAGVERRLHVHSGEPLVPIPHLEKDVSRRTFFTNFTNAIGVVLALPLLYPVLRYLIHPMYIPFNNNWLTLGDVSTLEPDKPKLIKFMKTVKEGYLTREFQKSHWVVKPSEELRKKIYEGEPVEFEDGKGRVYWKNDPEDAVVVMSGKCPHLGCAFKWKENHKRFGKVFWCPCHLSIYDASGKVLDGPAPRRLDILPTRIGPGGKVEIIDAEFKAGKTEMIRII